MTEQQLQKKILNYLEGIDAFTVKTINCNKNGVPDILCCLHGDFIAIEVKLPGNSASKLQDYQIDRIRAAGGIAFVATSVDEVKKRLNK